MSRFVSVVFALILVIGMSAPLGAQDAPTGPQPVGIRPDAPPYAVHGPYWVGTRDFVIVSDAAPELRVHAWYPALNPTGSDEVITYHGELKDSDLPADLDAIIYGQALSEASIDPSGAPYPLVVLSHGFGAPAHWYAYLMEHWASYGYVVLAPEHHEDYQELFTGIWESSIERPRDVIQVIDYAQALTEGDGALAGAIDLEHIAVAGHSYGGYTALAMGGARYDMAAFEERCAALAPDDPYLGLCALLVGFEAELATTAGLDAIPQGLWPSLGDPRVDAIIPMAGDSYMFDQSGLAAITVPMMAMGGTVDIGTPYEWGALPAFEYASSTERILVAFENANHMIFAAGCDAQPFIDGLVMSYWVCMDDVWEMDRAHDLINHFTTAFLLDTLYGDAEAHAALAPDAVAFPGITYEAVGF